MQPLTNMIQTALGLLRLALLRDWLQDNLSAYLLPTSIVVLTYLPKTIGGKIDRFALRSMSAVTAGCTTLASAPRTETERIVANIWAEVLELNFICLRDDFFYLGGNSLKALRVVSRFRDAFKVELPIEALFTTRTVSTLAELIENAEGRNPRSTRVYNQYAKGRRLH